MIRGAVLLGMTMAVALPAWTHTDEYFESIAAPYGGQLRMVGLYHLELVIKNSEVTLYVTDHAKNKITTDGGITRQPWKQAQQGSGSASIW